MKIRDAHRLSQTSDCKMPGCIRESLGATNGPYAYLCDEHTEQARKKRSEMGRVSSPGRSRVDVVVERDASEPPPVAELKPLKPTKPWPGFADPDPPASPSLSKVTADLDAAARELEAAIDRRRSARDDAKACLDAFKTCLSSVSVAAEALIR